MLLPAQLYDFENEMKNKVWNQFFFLRLEKSEISKIY